MTTPAQARLQFREGLVTQTSGWCTGFTQANIIALPADLAYDFLLFAQRNPKPCPVLDVLEAGEVSGPLLDGDIRTDLPLYRVFRSGELSEEVSDARPFWREDLVTFLIGCSFTFEHPLAEAGVPLRHVQAKRNVAMYVTNRGCRPAGVFSGPMVVSMRPIPGHLVARAVTISARYPAVHGAPVHVGDPEALGIDDLDRPDFGDSPVIETGDVPVFWACGVTPQAVVLASRPEFAITHSPGHMLITDSRESQQRVG